ncbi:MAG: hypothetical protein HQK77_13580 [Desulfobacterales bacterium]|nr:hypothetical protein [Desulfobacterales bacterium]
MRKTHHLFKIFLDKGKNSRKISHQPSAISHQPSAISHQPILFLKLSY